MAYVEAGDEDVGDELPVRERRHLGTERQQIKDVGAERRNRPCQLARIHHAERRRVGLKVHPRMRLETDQSQRRAEFSGVFGGVRDDALVADVNAIEIAERHGRALVGGIEILPAVDDLHSAVTRVAGKP